MALGAAEGEAIKARLDERHYAVLRSYVEPEQLAVLQRSAAWVGRLSLQARIPEGLVEARRSSAHGVRQLHVSPDRLLARMHPPIAQYRRVLFTDLHEAGVVPTEWGRHEDIYEHVNYVMIARPGTERGFEMHRDDRHMDPGVVAITMVDGSRSVGIVRAIGEYYSRAPKNGQVEFQEVLDEGDVLLLDSQKRPWHTTHNALPDRPSTTVVFAHRYTRQFADQTMTV